MQLMRIPKYINDSYYVEFSANGLTEPSLAAMAQEHFHCFKARDTCVNYFCRVSCILRVLQNLEKIHMNLDFKFKY